jgi:hypothetical protein
VEPARELGTRPVSRAPWLEPGDILTHRQLAARQSCRAETRVSAAERMPDEATGESENNMRRSNFVGEVFSFFPLCIDEGSFCSMLNHEHWTAAVTCDAPRATNGQILREQFEHLRVGGCAISVGIHLPNSDTTTAVMPCISLCKSFGESPQPTTNPRDRVKKVEMTLCTFSLATSSPCGAAKSLSDRGTETLRRGKTLWTKHQIGRERPHFFGFQPPKKFVGSLPPFGAMAALRVLSACQCGRKTTTTISRNGIESNTPKKPKGGAGHILICPAKAFYVFSGNANETQS